MHYPHKSSVDLKTVTHLVSNNKRNSMTVGKIPNKNLGTTNSSLTLDN